MSYIGPNYGPWQALDALSDWFWNARQIRCRDRWAGFADHATSGDAEPSAGLTRARIVSCRLITIVPRYLYKFRLPCWSLLMVQRPLVFVKQLPQLHGF
jgi:hypothetical protein